MNLKTILYGQFTPPLVVDSRKYSMWSNGSKPYKGYVPPVNRPTRYKAISVVLLQAIKSNPGSSRKELSAITGTNQSYLHRVIEFLIENDAIYGIKDKPTSGGYRSTIYYAKE